jgi:hypothetical protein
MIAGIMIVVSVPLLVPGPAAKVEVEVEEIVATCRPPGNGAGPLWCYGAPLLVRQGDLVFASVMETGLGVPPLSNTRWRLYCRDARGWRLVQEPSGFRDREPCPLVSPGLDQLVLSVNPSTEPPGTQYGRCDPHLLRFDTRALDSSPIAVHPPWPKTAHFTDHSYRGIAADSARGEVLVLNIDANTSAQHWAHETSAGSFPQTGIITFPIRACYPQVALRNRTACVLAIGDVVEPNEAWRAFKRKRTDREWDYVFRRLFYTSTPDITRRGFQPPIEIDTVEATGGHITNLDLWIDPKNTAHLLYLKTNVSPLLRDRFFPGQAIAATLEHVEVDAGKVTRRVTLSSGGDKAKETTQYARFQVTERGALCVVEEVAGNRFDGSPFIENRILAFRDGTDKTTLIPIPLKVPFTTFFTACERGGSRPSNVLDLFGIGGDGETLRYARVRIE